MKQLGNLAIVCAKKQDVLLQILDGKVTVHAGRGPDRGIMCVNWDDDGAINAIIHELNFGRFAKSQEVAGEQREQQIAG